MHRIVLLAALAAPLVAACGDSSDPPRSASRPADRKVTVAGPPSTLFAPLYVAQARGYFSEQGVDVEMQNVTAGQDAVALVASRKVDAIVGGFSAGMFSALERGLEFKVVGSMGASTGKDPAPSALMVSRRAVDSGKVKQVADLKGAKIGIAGGPGSAGGYLLASVLQTAGLKLTDVRVVNVALPDQEKAVKSGAVLAALPPAPFTTAMETDGVATEFASPPAGTTSTGVIYGSEFAKSDLAQKFFNGLVKGALDLQTESQKRSPEVLKILSDATGQKVDVLRKVPFYDWDPALAPPQSTLDGMQQAYMQAGLVKYDHAIPDDTFIDPSLSQEAAAVAAGG
jgi:NitT/TauT family transport system substrate-binding protein